MESKKEEKELETIRLYAWATQKMAVEIWELEIEKQIWGWKEKFSFRNMFLEVLTECRAGNYKQRLRINSKNLHFQKDLGLNTFLHVISKILPLLVGYFFLSLIYIILNIVSVMVKVIAVTNMVSIEKLQILNDTTCKCIIK